MLSLSTYIKRQKVNFFYYNNIIIRMIILSITQFVYIEQAFLKIRYDYLMYMN